MTEGNKGEEKNTVEGGMSKEILEFVKGYVVSGGFIFTTAIDYSVSVGSQHVPVELKEEEGKNWRSVKEFLRMIRKQLWEKGEVVSGDGRRVFDEGEEGVVQVDLSKNVVYGQFVSRIVGDMLHQLCYELSKVCERLENGNVFESVEGVHYMELCRFILFLFVVPKGRLLVGGSKSGVEQGGVGVGVEYREMMYQSNIAGMLTGIMNCLRYASSVTYAGQSMVLYLLCNGDVRRFVRSGEKRVQIQTPLYGGEWSRGLRVCILDELVDYFESSTYYESWGIMSLIEVLCNDAGTFREEEFREFRERIGMVRRKQEEKIRSRSQGVGQAAQMGGQGSRQTMVGVGMGGVGVGGGGIGMGVGGVGGMGGGVGVGTIGGGRMGSVGGGGGQGQGQHVTGQMQGRMQGAQIQAQGQQQ